MAVSNPNATKDLNAPIFLLSNICNLVSLRLDSTNFILWKFQLTSILKAHRLYGLVDGSTAKPSEFLAASSSDAVPSPNLAFSDWIAKDHVLMTLINATLSPAALAYVVGCSSSKEVWETLIQHYSSNSHTNIVSIKSDRSCNQLPRSMMN